MRRLAILIAVALAGCGQSAPSSVVPADASVYVGLSAAEAERLPALTSQEVDFEREIRPWLGDRAAYFARADDEYGLVFAADDEEEAEAFGRRVATAGPLRASAVIDGYLVLASSRELLRAANAAAGGQALANSTRLDVTGEDEDDPPEILLATQDTRAFTSGLDLFDFPSRGPALDLAGDGPLTARLWDEVTEVKGLPARGPAPSLEDAPGAARVAIAASDLSAHDPLEPARDALARVRAWPDVGLYEAARPYLGAATMFVQGRSFFDIGARLVADTDDEAALRRDVVAAARDIYRRRWNVDVNLGRDFLQIGVSRRKGLGPHLYLQVKNGRFYIDFGTPVGGVAEDLGDTRRYRDATRRLGGAPTLLIDELAARDDGAGTLRISRGAG
jgi:hypothetical protein